MAAVLSFDTAYRQVKRGQLAPVYYLTGDESVLKDELVQTIVEHAVDAGSRDFNVDIRSAADLDGEVVHALVETPPMLAERRVVVIKNLEFWRKNAKVWSVLERYVERPSPTTVLVLVHGVGEKPHRTLTRACAHVDLTPLSPDRIARWVAARAKQSGLALSEDATVHLIDAVGNDLSMLATELDKLAALADADRPLTAREVAPLVGMRHGETPHDWVQAVLERDRVRAVQMLPALLSAAGVTAVRLIATLGTALIGLRVAVAAMADGQPRRQAERTVFAAIREARPYGLRNWGDEASAWVRAAARWSPAEVNSAIRLAYEADRALKSTTVSDDLGILTSMVLACPRNQVAA